VEAMSVDIDRPLERPTTLKQIQNVYETHKAEDVEVPDPGRHGSQGVVDKSLAILSPFDEQEEWAKISEIMASFGTGLVRESVFVTELEQEFQSRLGTCARAPLKFSESHWSCENSSFLYCLEDVVYLWKVLSIHHQGGMELNLITNFATCFPTGLSKQGSLVSPSAPPPPASVAEWLRSIDMAKYERAFVKHGFDDLDFIVSLRQTLN
jgi:SAM domain (Sterile alpha motif)